MDFAVILAFASALFAVTLAMVIANAKVSGYLRRNPTAWGTIS